MYSLMKSGAALVFCAGMMCTGAAWAQSAGDNAVQAAMDACENYKEMDDAKMNCYVGAIAMQKSVKASNEGSEGVVHFDFNDFNDTAAQKAAKQSFKESPEQLRDGGRQSRHEGTVPA